MELCALAQTYIDKWNDLGPANSYVFTGNDLGFEFESRQVHDDQGQIYTISKASRVPGLTLERHRHYRENLAEYLGKMSDGN